MKKSYIFLILTFCVLFFQNCSQVGLNLSHKSGAFSSASQTPGSENDSQSYNTEAQTQSDTNNHNPSTSPPVKPSGVFFQDTFESGNLNSSEKGFYWFSANSVTVSSQKSKTGSYALKFHYPMSPLRKESMSELRFYLGDNYSDLWIKYEIYIPQNYFHRDNFPGEGTSWWTGGSKEFVLYADDYSGHNPTFVLGRWAKRTDTSIPNYINNGSSWSAGDFSYDYPEKAPAEQYPRYWEHLEEESKEPNVINTVTDLGKWQTRIIHVKMATTSTSNDGAVEYWIKKANGQIIKVLNLKNKPLYGNFSGRNQNYLNFGYLMGEADSGFSEDTDFFIDDFQASTTNVWGNLP